MNRIGLILGHGLQLTDLLKETKEHFIDTPYGKPSGRFITGKIKETEVILLYRHGDDDTVPAFAVNYKANMFVFQDFGVSHVLATSVCGSLQEEIMVGEFVVFDQFIDLTKYRELSYYEKLPLNKLNHSAFDKPFSHDIRNALIEAAVVKGITIHTKGTVLAVDGPRQSTRAESNLFRHWGADVVNTTTAPEAILAHELGIPYGVISLCTYYDTWRTDIPPATREEKVEVMEENAARFKEMVLETLKKL